MTMALRCEIFPADLDASVDFYTRVLGFDLVQDQRQSESPYVFMKRGTVRIGAATWPAVADPQGRRPPTGVELVLEVADVAAERERVVSRGWALDEDLEQRPWGLTDFRILDPDGYYLRVTSSNEDTS